MTHFKQVLLVTTAIMALAMPASAGGFGFNKKATASVGAEVGGGSACDGICKTVTTTGVKTSTKVSTLPKAEYSFAAEGKTAIGGLGFHSLGMESALGGAGYGVADASKHPSASDATMDGSIVSYGEGDVVAGHQEIEGSLGGAGIDTAWGGLSGAGAQMSTQQGMVSVDVGHQSSSAYSGSETEVSVEAND